VPKMTKALRDPPRTDAPTGLAAVKALPHATPTEWTTMTMAAAPQRGPQNSWTSEQATAWRASLAPKEDQVLPGTTQPANLTNPVGAASDQVVRLYHSKHEQEARNQAASDGIREGLEMVSTSWDRGKRRTRDKVAAVVLLILFLPTVFGSGAVVLWLIFGRPLGTLTVVLRPPSSAVAPLAPEVSSDKPEISPES
jgi:hypothetical protein